MAKVDKVDVMIDEALARIKAKARGEAEALADRLMPVAWDAYLKAADATDDHGQALRAALVAAIQRLQRTT